MLCAVDRANDSLVVMGVDAGQWTRPGFSYGILCRRDTEWNSTNKANQYRYSLSADDGKIRWPFDDKFAATEYEYKAVQDTMD